MNQTVSPPSLQAIHLPQFDSTPFYYSHKPTLLDDIPDTYLALAAPVLAYWSLSLFFHYLDMSEWKWLEKYRIHDSSEVKSRNLATRTQVVQAVLFQQLLQTLLGLVWLEEESSELPKHAQNMESIARWILPALGGTVGDKWGVAALGDLTYFVYWWAIPIFQLFLAMYVPSSRSQRAELKHHNVIGSSLTHGNTSFTAGCMSTNSCIGISTHGTTVYTCHTRSGRCTTTP